MEIQLATTRGLMFGSISAAFEPTYTRTLYSILSTLSDTDKMTQYTAATRLILGGHICGENSAGLHAQAQTRWLIFGAISAAFEPASFSCEFCRVANPGSNSSAFEPAFEPLV